MTGAARRARRPRALWWLLAIASVGLLLGALAFAPLAVPPATVDGGILVGRDAPPLRGTTLEGGHADLAELGAGRLTWVNFWATSCEPCRTEMPAMQALAERYGEALVVLGVNWGEATDSVTDFVRRYEVDYPIVLDPTLDTYYAWNRTDGLPRHFFVDGDGIVVREVIGPLAPEEMVAVLEELIGPA